MSGKFIGIKILTFALIGFGMSPFFAIFATPIVAIHRIIFYVLFKRKKLVEKAKKDGYVTEAKLQKSYDEPRRNGGGYTGAKVGVYTYECNGKTRKYKMFRWKDGGDYHETIKKVDDVVYWAKCAWWSQVVLSE